MLEYPPPQERILVLKNKNILPLAARWMNGEDFILLKVTQTQKEVPYECTYVSIKYGSCKVAELTEKA